MRICTIIAIAGALAVVWSADSGVAQTHSRHRVKHPYVRVIERPPGYSRGGPMYTACDRINRDRMLVGTCR
jgi:hypothetical protein